MKVFRSILAVILVGWVALTLIYTKNIHKERELSDEELATRWYKNYSVVAHAMGDIDGYAYTNSLEAFEKHYANGTRVFETDFSLTSDEKIVLTHGWRQHKSERLGMGSEADATPMSYEDFMNSPIYGQYTPLDLDDLINLMIKYPDIYIVMDFGSDLDYDYEEEKDYIFELDMLMKRNIIIIDRFKEVDESLLDRMIPQIYYEKHLYALDEYYPFKNYIYTLYKNFMNTSASAVVDFCDTYGIDVITTNLIGDQTVITKEILRQFNNNRERKKSKAIFLHTYDYMDEVKGLLEDGYNGIYSNLLDENDLRELTGNNGEGVN